VSTLRSALDELRVEDLRYVGDDGLAADLDELERAARILEAERSRRLAEFERRGAHSLDVTRVITQGASEPLDVGRRTKVVSAALRRAVTVRDRGCRFPGCERPPGWTDAHHVRHWADGGATALGNLVLLCRPHHRAIHRGFRVEMVDGTPRFSRLDGTNLTDRGPPLRYSRVRTASAPISK
jgi:HNH endonuclease